MIYERYGWKKGSGGFRCMLRVRDCVDHIKEVKCDTRS